MLCSNLVINILMSLINKIHFYKKILAISATVFVFGMSLLPSENIPDKVLFSWDKLNHFIAYFSLAILWFWYYNGKNKFQIIFALISLGIIIEIMQEYLINSRTGDYLDVMANNIGIAIGMIAFFIIKKIVYIYS